MSSKVTIARDVFKRVLNVEKRPANGGGWLIRLPGLQFNSFNRAGLLNVANLDHIDQVDRSIDMEMGDGRNVFIIGRCWTFSKRLYQRASVGFPMTIRWTASHIGTSSFDTHQTFFEGGNESDDFSASELLASVVSRAVNVDPTTRKAAPLPKVAVDYLSLASVTDGERFRVRVEPPIIPDKTYACRIRIRHDDMDFLFHTNTSSLLGFALECAALAAQDGFYTRIRGDVAFLPVRRIDSVFLAESRAGDDVDVLTWEDENNKMLLNFAIKKADKVIYGTQVEYFEDPIIVSTNS